MLVSIALLALTLAIRDDSGTAVSALTATIPTQGVEPDEPAALPTSTPTPNPFAVASTNSSLLITRLWSPAPNTARAEGSMASGEALIEVRAAGQAPREVLVLADANGSFVVDIDGLAPGPQELCLDDACQRVLIVDPATEDRVTIDARIEEAIRLAGNRLDIDAVLPGWTIQIGGPNTSTGGTTNAASRSITINANSGRTVTDYEITVLHEIAHGVDAQWLTDATREQFRSLRGHDPTLLWGPVDELAVGQERWRNSAEDFAEVFVAWLLDNNYSIETTIVAPQPSDCDLRSFCALIAVDGLGC